MSLGEANAKFPSQGNADRGPSPTRENPAGVFPKSSPSPAPGQSVPGTGGAPANPASILSNPFAWDDTLTKLEDALTGAIAAIDDERRSNSNIDEAHSLLTKLKGWKGELEAVRRGEMGGFQYSERSKETSPNSGVGVSQNEGGMFID